jgi:hypothetical protein
MLIDWAKTRTGVPANGAVQLETNYRPGSYFAEVKQGDHKQIIKLIKGSQ